MDREAERPARPAGASAREQLAALFDGQHQRLFRLACRLTADREEARDLVQETFLRAARQVEEAGAAAIATAVPGEGWLVRTLVNLCRDHHRRGVVRARARLALAAAAPAAAGAEEPAVPGAEAAVVARAAVRSALAGLPPRRRAVVVLHEIEERPVREVAALLGIAAVTVRWHLLAARRELARRLLAPGGSSARGAAARGGGAAAASEAGTAEAAKGTVKR